MVSNSSLFTPALLRTHSFVFFAVHETRSILRSPFISKARRRVSSYYTRCYVSVRSKADMSQLIYSAYLTDKTDKDIPLHWCASDRRRKRQNKSSVAWSTVPVDPTFLTLPECYAEQGLRNGLASVSVCPRLSDPSIDSSNGGQRVCCLAPCGQDISIDGCGRASGAVLQARRRSAANAVSVML